MVLTFLVVAMNDKSASKRRIDFTELSARNKTTRERATRLET